MSEPLQDAEWSFSFLSSIYIICSSETSFKTLIHQGSGGAAERLWSALTQRLESVEPRCCLTSLNLFPFQMEIVPGPKGGPEHNDMLHYWSFSHWKLQEWSGKASASRPPDQRTRHLQVMKTGHMAHSDNQGRETPVPAWTVLRRELGFSLLHHLAVFSFILSEYALYVGCQAHA